MCRNFDRSLGVCMTLEARELSEPSVFSGNAPFAQIRICPDYTCI